MPALERETNRGGAFNCAGSSVTAPAAGSAGLAVRVAIDASETALAGVFAGASTPFGTGSVGRAGAGERAIPRRVESQFDPAGEGAACSISGFIAEEEVAVMAALGLVVGPASGTERWAGIGETAVVVWVGVEVCVDKGEEAMGRLLFVGS